MKFLCPNCKAKYQISDEKIVGRTLKMDCRRCSHPIVIRGDKLAAEPEPAEAPRAGAPKPASRSPGSGSHVGPAPASRQSSRTALGADFRKNAGAAAAPAKPTALDQWHVAIHDVPVGPMKRDEVANKIGAGAVTGDSLCWREGFDDWRPLRDVPELAELLRRAAAPPPPSRALPRAAPPGAPRPARPPAQRLPPQSPQRPAESARPAARGNVVPIGGRLGAAAAPAVEDFSDEMPDDEPTRVGSSLDLIRAEEERRAAEEARAEQERKEQQRQDEEAARARHAEEEARRDAAERDAAAARAPTAAFAEEDAFDPFASQRAPLEMQASPMQSKPVFAPPAEPLPPSASYAAPLPETPRRRGLPVGAWIAIAGAMAFGATLAVMFGIKMFNEPPAPVAVAVPQPPTEPAGPTEAVPDPTLTAPDPVPDPPVAEDPEATDPTPAAPTNGTRTPREGTPSTTPREPTTPTTPARHLDPAAAARLAQFEDDGAGAAPINVRDRNNPLDEDTQRGTGELSQDQIRTVVNRERSMVQRCYETATRAAGQAPSLRIDVDLTIGSSGTVTSATARGPGFGSLTECVERTVRRWRFPASGGSSRLSIPFVFQGQD